MATAIADAHVSMKLNLHPDYTGLAVIFALIGLAGLGCTVAPNCGYALFSLEALLSLLLSLVCLFGAFVTICKPEKSKLFAVAAFVWAVIISAFIWIGYPW